MHIFKSLCFLKEINNLLLSNLAACIICFEYWFCTVAWRSLSIESIRIILFKTPHLRLQRKYFFGLAETLAVLDFQSSCACSCSATFMTCAAHLWKQHKITLKLSTNETTHPKINVNTASSQFNRFNIKKCCVGV